MFPYSSSISSMWCCYTRNTKTWGLTLGRGFREKWLLCNEPGGRKYGTLRSLRFFLLHPLDRVPDKLTGITQGHFLFDVLAIRLHGLYAQVQLFGNAAGSVSLADESKNLQLAVTESIDGKLQSRSAGSNKLLQHLVGHSITQIDFSAQHSTQRHQHILSRVLLHDIA